MKVWLKFLIILVICIVLLGSVYVWRFGWPKWENKEQKMLQNITDNISNNMDGQKLEEKILVELQQDNIVFTKQGDIKQQIVCKYEKGMFSIAVNEKEMDMKFFDYAVSAVFEAIAVYNGYNEDNAIYSLTPDILNTKTLEKDGFQYTSLNNVSRFMVKTNKKLNLAQKDEVYIKESDLLSSVDILKNKLQYKLIEKVGITVEKNISYSRNLVFVIYEQDKLTDRTYKSLMSILKVITNNNTLIEYVKENYPSITRAGTLTLNGISISLNEGLGEGNVHYYDLPENWEYMLVKINIDKYT